MSLERPSPPEERIARRTASRPDTLALLRDFLRRRRATDGIARLGLPSGVVPAAAAHLLPGAGLLLLLATGVAAQEARRTPPAFLDLVPLGGGAVGNLSLPEGAAPDHRFPVLLLIRDAMDPGLRGQTYTDRFLENGVAVFEPDYFGGAEEPIEGPPDDQLGPALAAIAADPRLDRQRLAVLGLGHGARAALRGLGAGRPARALALLYPGCDATLAAAAGQTGAAARVLLLHGDADASNHPGACAGLAAAFPPGVAVTHRVIPGATHGWDAFEVVQPGKTVGLPDPFSPDPHGNGPIISARPDQRTTQVVADRVLGFVLRAIAPAALPPSGVDARP
ncbi:MAG: dienelactone hydrolase family protein [Paracraurococcus sp.]